MSKNAPLLAGQPQAAETELFTEFLYAGHGQVLTVDEVIFRERGVEQDVLVFRNQRYGRVMALEGAVQVTEQDEFIYHETMAHVPLLAHGAAKDVLIIGGGDGGTLRHVLMHPNVTRAVMVEIEPSVIDLAKQYFPKVCGEAFVDPRTNLIIGDGCAYVRETAERFDVIIVDATDPIGPGKVLYTPEFYAACKRCLKPNGLLRTHTGMATEQNTALTETVAALRHSFSHVQFSLATIPTYVPGCMVFGLSGDNAACFNISEAVLAERLQTSGISCRYYTPALHLGSTALPQFVLDFIDKT